MVTRGATSVKTFSFLSLTNQIIWAVPSSVCAMDLPSLEIEEMRSSPTHRVNANSSDPVNTLQEIFKSCSNQHQSFVNLIQQAMVLLQKYKLETTTKFSNYESGKMFGTGGNTFFSNQGHTRSRWETPPPPLSLF